MRIFSASASSAGVTVPITIPERADPMRGQAAPAPRAAMARSIAAPVVVELFTAQGCSTCPAADALLAGLADLPGGGDA